MDEKQAVPWSFTIEFDEQKAAQNGYSIDSLYDCVDKNIRHLGIERLSLGTWHVKNLRDKVTAQCVALCGLLARHGLCRISRVGLYMRTMRQMGTTISK